jgi:L-lactate dehydrogenase complex protein LldG
VQSEQSEQSEQPGQSAREMILAAIRAALADVPSDEAPDDVPVSRDYLVSHLVGDVVAVFAERVADYRATVTRVAESGMAEAVARILRDRGITSLVVPPGFPDEPLAAYQGTRLLDTPHALTPAELDAADGVITTAAAGIALTGTIVLDAGPGQGRRALSLVPDYHLCLVRSSQIAEDVPGAVRGMDPRRPTTLISGPSATSDIELDRVEGVHGPRTLDVLIVQA